jgi:ribulose-phosphate 3-epimerase
MLISGSFLSIKNNLKENIIKLDKSNIDYLHLDIMDSYFVPNITWNIEEIKTLLAGTTKKYDVHLMVKDVYKYIDDYSTLNPEYITIHLEACDNILDALNYIKNKNIKAGISIKPNTSVKELIPYLKYIDLVLVMSVEPGLGGQVFIPNTTNKLRTLNELKKEYNFIIEVDGGINEDTIKYCMYADIIVVGSFITNSDNYNQQIELLKLK